jgi:hypothetical protein
LPELTETKSSKNPSLIGNLSHTTSASDYPKCSMRKKEKLDRQVQAKNPFGSYSPEYQQLIEGTSLPVHYATKPALARQGDTSG